MNRRDFLAVLPLLAFPVAACAEAWPYPHVSGEDGCGPDDGPMVTLTFAARPVRHQKTDFPFLSLRLRGRLSDLAGKTFRLGAATDPLFSAQSWTGPRAWKPLTAAAVRIDRLDGEKFTVGLIEVELESRKWRAAGLTGSVLPNRMPCG